jgi:peroxiredoxin
MSTHTLLVAVYIACTLPPPLTRDDDKLIGKPAPSWQVENWINSPPLTLESLAGKVVLVRWWTAPYCPYCKATAPALNDFHTKYKDRGLVVIGFFHHKEPTPFDVNTVKRWTDKYGFAFPVAVDPRVEKSWKTLDRWWLSDGKKAWTSVTFLIDRAGVIRHIHPGGQYVPGDKGYEELKEKIEELLNEK